MHILNTKKKKSKANECEYQRLAKGLTSAMRESKMNMFISIQAFVVVLQGPYTQS